jgi:hypothetical protein
MVSKWILQLKKGDQWFDSSLNYVGTCDKIVGTSLTLTWQRLDKRWTTTHTINILCEIKLDNWIPMSSLMKELI